MEACYSLLLEIVHECILKYIPPKIPHRSGQWIVKAPRQLERQRASLWSIYKNLRREVGPDHSDAVSAWEQFSLVNYSYRHYARLKHCEYEMKLIRLLREAPKIFIPIDTLAVNISPHICDTNSL